MDDFGPAKNLMTMCFTYYHIGEEPAWLTGRADPHLPTPIEWRFLFYLVFTFWLHCVACGILLP